MSRRTGQRCRWRDGRPCQRSGARVQGEHMGIDAKDPVGKLAGRALVTVGEAVTLRSLARLMDEHDIGAVVVDRPDLPAGVVTERDVIRALAEGADPDIVWAPDVMSWDPVTIERDQSILRAALRSVDEGVRHLVVVDEGRPTGMVSARDLLQIVADDLLDEWS